MTDISSNAMMMIFLETVIACIMNGQNGYGMQSNVEKSIEFKDCFVETSQRGK